MSQDATTGERSLSVALVSPSWPADGAANGIVSYVDRIIPSLRRLGHRPCVISAGIPGAGLGKDVYQLWDERRPPVAHLFDGIAFRLNLEDALRKRFAGHLITVTRRAIAERGVELLEMEETFGISQLVRPRLTIPLVVRIHGPHFAKPSSDLSQKRVRREGVGIARADAVSAVSKEILERTRAHYGLPLEEAVVIPNPAPMVPDEQRWRRADCDPSRILFVGRFDRIKGGDVVIDCMRILIRRFPNLRLWFVGPDTGFEEAGKRRSLPEYLASRGAEVAARVDWLGTQSQASLGDLRRKAALTMVASRYETFGLTALEAMARGCPLVAPRVGGVCEMVVDGINGLLCLPADPEDMAAKAGQLLSDPELAARLGHRAAQDAAGRYHPDTIGRQTVALYQRLLERNRRRKRESG